MYSFIKFNNNDDNYRIYTNKYGDVIQYNYTVKLYRRDPTLGTVHKAL